MKIILSGWTAAGKTTHGRLLAAATGWPCLRMSTIMNSIVRDRDPTTGADWLPSDDQFRESDHLLDRAADHIMGELMSSHRDAIVDAWLQPWMYTASDAVRIWISSDLNSRCMKTQVSRLRLGLTPDDRVLDVVSAKDAFSARHFSRLYQIKFGYDRSVFDLRLDNSSHISAATIEASDAGISTFHRKLCDTLSRDFGLMVDSH